MMSCDIPNFCIYASFPIHYKNLRCHNYLPEQKRIYEEYMQGCYTMYGQEACDDYDNDRIRMSLYQVSKKPMIDPFCC
jgi:hypothetical protein